MAAPGTLTHILEVAALVQAAAAAHAASVDAVATEAVVAGPQPEVTAVGQSG